MAMASSALPGQSFELSRRAIGPVNPWSCIAATVEVGTAPKVFSTEDSREDVEDHGAECNCASREALSSLLRGLDVLSCSSMFRFFLDCGRHMFPRLSEATAASSDCPVRLAPIIVIRRKRISHCPWASV